VSSLCSSGRVYIGTVDMSNADLIVFNGIYVQQSDVLAPDASTTDTGPTPIYKHESREQFLHLVYVDGLPRWRIGVRSVGGQTDFVDYLSESSVDVDDPTSSWYAWNALSHSWSRPIPLHATCADSDFVTCTSGLLSVSGLSRRHLRWHGRRMGTYRITSLTNQLRPVYKSVYSLAV